MVQLFANWVTTDLMGSHQTLTRPMNGFPMTVALTCKNSYKILWTWKNTTGDLLGLNLQWRQPKFCFFPIRSARSAKLFTPIYPLWPDPGCSETFRTFAGDED